MTDKETIAIPIAPQNSPNLSEERPQAVPTQSNLNTVIFANTIIDNLEDPIKSMIYSRAKTVKYLTLIDMFFLIVNLIVSIVTKNLFWLFFIFIPLCYSGFEGATKYKKTYLIGYIIYLTIMTFFYLFLTFYYNSFLILLVFFIEVYILTYTSRLYSFLNNASDEVIESLQNNWRPTNAIYYYY